MTLTMISKRRMKADLLGQSLLLSGAVTAGLVNFFSGWFIAMVAMLGLWQGASAFHLAIAHEYQQRYPFLWLFVGLLLALPLAIWLLNYWAVVPIALGAALYYYVTIRDTAIVMQRPRSFWDL